MRGAIPVATVTAKGAILLGSNVVADGPAPRPVRAVTHAHSDHVVGLGYNARESVFIAATETTLKFLDILGYRVPPHKRLAMPYWKPVEFDGEELMLAPARHIAGSAQVVVEGKDYRVGYTGDFKMPGTPPLEDLDVLVVDATYGSPELERRWREWDAIAALIKVIDENYGRGPVWVYGYNGKLEEIIFELRRRGAEYEFYAEPRTLALARVAAEFYGMELRGLHPLSEFPGWGVVLLYMTKFKYYRRRSGVHVLLTGWELKAEARALSDKVVRVSFSDHASFSEIMEYISAASPRLVVVDAYRGSKAALTAKFIERRLGIPAVAAP